jgi:hypothetical protein
MERLDTFVSRKIIYFAFWRFISAKQRSRETFNYKIERETSKQKPLTVNEYQILKQLC